MNPMIQQLVEVKIFVYFISPSHHSVVILSHASLHSGF